MASPRLEPVVLTDEERQVLGGWARRRKTAQALALRSRIILACADGTSVSEVSAELGVSRTTAGRGRGAGGGRGSWGPGGGGGMTSRARAVRARSPTRTWRRSGDIARIHLG